MALKNVALIEFNDGYILVQDDDSVTAHGGREVGLNLGDCTGPMALHVAQANLEPVTDPEISIVAEFEPLAGDEADQVRVVTGLGGTVLVDSLDGTPTGYRIKAHSGAEDNDGKIVVRPELDTARDVLEQRWHRWLSRTNNGSNDGRSQTATVSSRSVTGAQVTNKLGGLDFSTGGAYSIIGDRGSARRPTEAALVVGFQAFCDVPGADGDTTYRVEVDGSTIGTVTLPDGEGDDVGDATFTLSVPVLVDDENLLNIECTAEGGHTGASVQVIAIPIG